MAGDASYSSSEVGSDEDV